MDKIVGDIRAGYQAEEVVVSGRFVLRDVELPTVNTDKSIY
jgi:hypothetical protein